jgi:hypothetical protein
MQTPLPHTPTVNETGSISACGVHDVTSVGQLIVIRTASMQLSLVSYEGVQKSCAFVQVTN